MKEPRTRTIWSYQIQVHYRKEKIIDEKKKDGYDFPEIMSEEEFHGNGTFVTKRELLESVIKELTESLIGEGRT